MAQITIYSTQRCPFCDRAKALLNNKGVEFEEIRVDEDSEQMQAMIERSMRRTVPQIFIDEHHVGGFDALYAADQSGELDKLLGK